VAKWDIAVPPAAVKEPPIQSTPLTSCRAFTDEPAGPVMPVPMAVHDVPVHRAMRTAVGASAPMLVNVPPTTSPSPTGLAEMANTAALGLEVPTADQAAPSQDAMYAALVPDTDVKPPPCTE
jgi:hypothetical protein